MTHKVSNIRLLEDGQTIELEFRDESGATHAVTLDHVDFAPFVRTLLGVQNTARAQRLSAGIEAEAVGATADIVPLRLSTYTFHHREDGSGLMIQYSTKEGVDFPIDLELDIARQFAERLLREVKQLERRARKSPSVH